MVNRFKYFNILRSLKLLAIDRNIKTGLALFNDRNVIVDVFVYGYLSFLFCVSWDFVVPVLLALIGTVG